MQVFAFAIPPHGLVFIRGAGANPYSDAFRKAKLLASQSRSSISPTFLRDSPADLNDAKSSAGSLLIEEVFSDGSIQYAGGSNAPVRATGGGSLAQTNFFEGGGGAKVMASGFDPDANGEKPPSPGEFDAWKPETAAPTERFSFRPGFEAGLRQAGIDVTGGGGVRGALASQAYDPLLARATLSAAFTPIGGEFDPEATQEDLLKDELTFRNFLKDQAEANALYGTGGAQAARGLFEKARTLSGDPVEALKALGEGGGISGQFLKPATIGQGSTLANVAREAGRQRFGSFARFLPGAGDLTQTYLSMAPEGLGNPQSFADFLNRRIFGT